MYLGTILSSVFPDYLTNYIGCLLLVCMGFWVILQSFHTDKKSLPNTSINKLEKSPKIHEFFMKGFGITIQIIRNPISSDLDQSKKIDAIEAFYLGIAMSIDSICVGIGSSILGFRSWLFPILVAVFQLLFLFLGKKMGKTLARTSRLPEYIWMILSGVILICIGISKIL